MKEIPVIAIDGPAAAGKGSVATRVAEMLNFHFLDSGKLYRAVAAVALSKEQSPDNDRQMSEIAQHLAQQLSIQPAPPYPGVSDDEISRPETGAAASRLAKIAGVRTALLPAQRAARRAPGLVADGRDMGTVVFPDATLKVFLTAKPEIRAQRRQKQLHERGIRATIEDVLADLTKRDKQDSARAGSPLTIAPGAVVVDASARGIQAVAAEIAEFFNTRR